MKFSNVISYLIGIAILFSCNPKKEENFYGITFHYRHTLGNMLNPRDTMNVRYTYNEMNFIYSDTTWTKIIDTLLPDHRINIDTSYYYTSNHGREMCMAINYIKSGNIKRGVIPESSLAYSRIESSQFKEVNYLGMLAPIDRDYNQVKIKSVKHSVTIAERVLDTVTTDITYLDIMILDSNNIAFTGEVLHLNTYYPACGHEVTHIYLNYMKNTFTTIIKINSWADAPYYNSTMVYFPTHLNEKRLLYLMGYGGIVRNDQGLCFTASVPDSITIPINQLIYIEKMENADSLKDGKPVLDEYDEPIQIDIITDRKFYKWTGKVLERLN